MCKNQFKFSKITLKRTNIPVLMLFWWLSTYFCLLDTLAMINLRYKNNNKKNNRNQYSLCKKPVQNLITLKPTNIPVLMLFLITFNILLFIGYLAMIISGYKSITTKTNNRNHYSLCKNQFKFTRITLKRTTNIPVLMLFWWLSTYFCLLDIKLWSTQI